MDADTKSEHLRQPSLPLLEDDADSFIYEDDGESNDGDADAELCLYVQRLEREKRELESEVQSLRDEDASLKVKLQATERRVEMHEASLQNAMNASDAFRQEKDMVLALEASERERMATLVALLEEAQNRYEDAERARQSAIFKLSSLQAAKADATSLQLLPPSPTAHTSLRHEPTGMSDNFGKTALDFGERIEKYKRDIELLRQRLALADEQAAERQRMAVSLALQDAQLDYSDVVERTQVECERRLNEWRHEEAVRAKEQERAVDEDRYSIRLEMKHAVQRTLIDQRVAYLQTQAELTAGPYSLRAHPESDFSIGTLDEVLVRMQLEQLRTRRFEALKKTLLIRRAKLDQAAKELFCRWKIQTSNTRILRLNAVLHMHRIVLHLEMRNKLTFFSEWKAKTRQLQAHSFQKQALSCWNRMLAVERISHVMEHATVKRTASYFHRWRLETSGGNTSKDTAAKATAAIAGSDEEAMLSLQQEIKKLHDQLASSKSEAWRYKRQLLKQFL